MNETIQIQLNHRSIRAFKDQALTKEEVELLVNVARHTATSKFMQAYSIISITDSTLKKLSEKFLNNLMLKKMATYFYL